MIKEKFKKNGNFFFLEKSFFLLRKSQPMAFVPDDSSLSSDQDTNQFLI